MYRNWNIKPRNWVTLLNFIWWITGFLRDSLTAEQWKIILTLSLSLGMPLSSNGFECVTKSSVQTAFEFRKHTAIPWNSLIILKCGDFSVFELLCWVVACFSWLTLGPKSNKWYFLTCQDIYVFFTANEWYT